MNARTSELEFWDRFGVALWQALRFLPPAAAEEMLAKVEENRLGQMAARRLLLTGFLDVTDRVIAGLQGEAFEERTLRETFQGMREVMRLEYMDTYSPMPPLMERRPQAED